MGDPGHSYIGSDKNAPNVPTHGNHQFQGLGWALLTSGGRKAATEVQEIAEFLQQ